MARPLGADGEKRSIRTVVAAVVVLLAVVLGMRGRRHMAPYPEVRKAELAAIYAEYPKGTSVDFLSVYAWEFPVVLEQEKVLGSRYLHLWILPAIIRTEDAGGYELKGPTKPGQTASLSALLRGNEAQDLERWKPAVVVVDRCTLHQFCDSEQRFGSLVSWFQIDSGFREQWSHYELEKTLDGLDVYTRTR
jgi:hypothetical protein